MTGEYIDFEQFAKDVHTIINNEEFDKLDPLFDKFYTEFETALYKAIPQDYFEQYKAVMISGVETLLGEVKNFKKEEKKPTISKSIINLGEAMDDTIKDIQEDAEFLSKLKD